MARSPEIVRSKYVFSWSIIDFPLYLRLSKRELNSPSFRIECSDLTHWCMSLCPIGNHVTCTLKRSYDKDDLERIEVKYKIYIIGCCGKRYFEIESTTTLDHVFQNVVLPHFLDGRLLKLETHIPGQILHLQCELDLAVNLKVAAERLYDNLKNLSNDLLQLYESQEASDMVLEVDGEIFKVHTFVLVSRCPRLFEIPVAGSSFSLPGEQNSFCLHNKIHKITEKIDEISTTYPDDDISLRGSRYYHTINPSVLDAALRFLYSGRMPTLDNDIKLDLLRVAHKYFLRSLIENLQEIEDSSYAVTEIIENTVTLVFDLNSLLSEGDQDFFKPINQLIKLSHSSKKCDYLSVLLFIIRSEDFGPMLRINCRFIDTVYPITLKSEILVLDKDVGETFESIKVFTSDDIWSPHIAVNCLPIRDIRLYCKFSICRFARQRMMWRRFSLPATDVLEKRSLRNLSNDIFQSLIEPGSFNPYDLTLIAEGDAMLVHRQLVYARLPFFKNQLLPKMQRDHMILQLVHETEAEVLQELIDYMYMGLVMCGDMGKIRKLRATAQRFRVTELINECDYLLQKQAIPLGV